MSLASVGNATAFGCTVVSTMTREKSEGLAAPVRVAVARLSWISATSFSSPIRWRQRVSDERSNGVLCRKNSSPQNSWKVRVLDPARAQVLVRQVVHRLEDRQARHQPRRQRRMARLVRIDRSEPLLEKPPVDRPAELRQRVAHVDDLVEPRPEQIVLSAVPPLLRPHRIALRPLTRRRNHGRPGHAICKITTAQTTKSGKREDSPLREYACKSGRLRKLHRRLHCYTDKLC